MSKFIAVDIETTGFIEGNVYPQILCMGFYEPNLEGIVFDNFVEVINKLNEKGYRLLFHNAKFDVEVLNHYGAYVEEYDDLRLLAYIRDNRRTSYSLDSLAKDIGEKKIDFDVKDLDDTVDKEKLAEYCLQDCKLTYKLFRKCLGEVDGDSYNVYEHIDLPYSLLIMEMESTGLYIDRFELTTLRQELSTTLEELKEDMLKDVPSVPYDKEYKKIHPELGEYVRYDDENKVFVYEMRKPFNPNSGQQIAWALTNIFGYKLNKTTNGGGYSTDKDALALLDKHPWVDSLIDYKKKNTIYTNFVCSLLDKACGNTVYGNFNQTSVKTSRLSSSKPNLNLRAA